ncbi:hypothetical protein ZIOFF_029181 [Zingiber officinale]|uniref:C2H2-type domain-containing protein n=1 Tax=Zingiber officinale TaxID=94328 RepID=A0A8J5GW96_ZINOF|nr:hypothetical protein ZIOFF_029181 [Zingiber officinale]
MNTDFELGFKIGLRTKPIRPSLVKSGSVINRCLSSYSASTSSLPSSQTASGDSSCAAAKRHNRLCNRPRRFQRLLSEQNPMAKDVIEFRRSEEFEDVIEEEEDEEEEQIEQWDDWQSDKEDSSADFLCLFCSSRFGSVEVLFDHCRCKHFFDFHSIVREWSLDFYGSFKLINYVRSQVSENKCWCCGLEFQCSRDLQNHLHPAPSFDKDGKFLWEDDHYLKPFMGDDPLLHSFGGDEDEEDDPMTINKEEIMRELVVHEKLPRLCNGGHSILNGDASVSNTFTETEDKTECIHILGNNFEGKPTDDIIFKPCDEKHKDGQLRESFANVTVKEIRNVNEKYFGAYGSFGIHREMLSDKVRFFLK